MPDVLHSASLRSAGDFSWGRLFAISSVCCFLVGCVLLRLFGVSLVPVALLSGTVFLLWLAFRYPMTGLGAVLAFMPLYPLAFLLAKFFGPSYLALFEGCDRVVLLVFTFILWRRNGVKLTTPDWFLLSCFGLAAIRFFFSGTLLGLLTDFNFIIAYAAGRVTVLSAQQQGAWAKRAVWIVAVLSVLGMLEVFFIGEAPRTLLYLSVANGGTEGNALDAAFHADQYLGLRESSTMFGPLQFAPLCMVGLVLWWVYCRNLVPAAMIVAGLICSVTRSAWVGTVLAIGILAILMNQAKRLLPYAGLALALFVIAIPLLGLGDYLTSTKSGQDPSGLSHQASLFDGVRYVLVHPIGVGAGNTGKWAVKEDRNAVGIEDTYLQLAAQYGIPTLACFFGFLATTLRAVWPDRTLLSYAAIGIVTGFSAVIMFAALHDVFPLACWLWFPIGVAVRTSAEMSVAETLS